MCVSSLRVSIRVILTTSLEIRREVFYFLDSCLTTSGNTYCAAFNATGRSTHLTKDGRE